MRGIVGVLISALLLTSTAVAQDEDNSLRVFGYFQNSFQHQGEHIGASAANGFAVQQLNLFLQKDLNPDWRAFISFELINSFSSERNWGDFSIEEAWVAYRKDYRFNLKLGLQIPVFNNLNEIKNRTPLLPYIVRPLLYETSFSQLIDLSVGIPARTFFQVYGYLPAGSVKLDYAGYIGNSPNINSRSQNGPTGWDTTTSLLFGGRVGARHRNLKAGVSIAHDRSNELAILENDPKIADTGDFVELTRLRLGGDLSYRVGPLFLESEVIYATYEEAFEDHPINVLFYYATVGAQATEKLVLYGTAWLSEYRTVLATVDDVGTLVVEYGYESSIDVASVGGAYSISDRIVLKAQVAKVWYEEIRKRPVKSDWEYIATGVSVWF